MALKDRQVKFRKDDDININNIEKSYNDIYQMLVDIELRLTILEATVSNYGNRITALE